ncbi:ABC transporter ATP-binding protein [Halobacteriovorax sp. JY17]|uniref:ATP-binding cassette domain-containing protein n=1 Tax=Halobacteriovorax sp. JY17 TaxID=2014617 RepID=UPI000C601584|nr:ABC transporter ATP-binding protein [Halobacteriovorax sp. JY17]PIK13628.1 MAG: hypothetical protein CES88_15670 [Halobacteriovorax sp. JY17]
MTYLSTVNLKIGYENSLSSPINFKLPVGEIIQVKGANGSGKSTLLKTLLGEIPSLGGEINWLISNKEISYLPQAGMNSHNFNFTLKEFLETYDVEQEIKQYLNPELANRLWVNSSGGERQLALILTRISKRTKVLILDEPLNHLDIKSRKLIEDLISELMKKRSNLSIIIVSHLEINLPKKELEL